MNWPLSCAIFFVIQLPSPNWPLIEISVVSTTISCPFEARKKVLNVDNLCSKEPKTHNKELAVGAFSFPPGSYIDGKGKYRGIDVSTLDTLGEYIDYNPKYITAGKLLATYNNPQLLYIKVSQSMQEYFGSNSKFFCSATGVNSGSHVCFVLQLKDFRWLNCKTELFRWYPQTSKWTNFGAG